MTTQHTPGPWSVWRDMDPNEPRMITGPSADFVCQVCEENTNDDANARLIAAAPDLFQACKHMVKIFNQELDEIEPLAAFAVIEKARAAIAKATQT